MSLALKSHYVGRRVVTARYFADADGYLRPMRPFGCAALEKSGTCHVIFHGWRERKVGPGFALAIFYCVPHCCCFTAYPEGWMPYGRRPMIIVTPTGLDITMPASGADAWNDTAFGAVSDAGMGRFWPKSSGDHKEWAARFGREAYGVLRTQVRHLSGANQLFALEMDLVKEQPRVAALLNINLSDIVATFRRARDGPKLKVAGQMGVELLSTVGQPRRRLLPGVVRLGSDRQYWGPPDSSNAVWYRF